MAKKPEERKFWGGMMPLSKIGKDGSGNPVSQEGKAKAAETPAKSEEKTKSDGKESDG